MGSHITINTDEETTLTDSAMNEVNLSLHGANRFLERDIPLEAVEGVRHLLPLLNRRPVGRDREAGRSHARRATRCRGLPGTRY